ncbi:putative conserved protein YndB, AHSA1/START domain [Streptoalloteichus tenebrarius]|uniref:Conserved protein YndB, AHSA1/START domain n=1 Tax=Streptoalloteichus tenebrarius (strain ATCC 17920 / DSM 40477 / JCM 4838 / CBS 697.72 / NBRC 16177 / NCIMB 11028 / NRRL B-12390 / A12253. 1 / ISP 5477) TaxID=1933 RepID=A0ABT1HNJ3_STRSD|nr:SRPBCC family protein [Streptoalloteichus tenebrarius]MCP2257068.1 putative conserved protein YndB, AHSA1/START domain [Streptoalloteichus tenebrarius]BFE98699.1 SRPBCC family protein [Streptoalloteichus tenebrarius]
MGTTNDDASADTVLSMPSDHEVVLTRVFQAPRQRVFDAFTQPEHVRHWLLGPQGWRMPVCEIDLRPGGSWRHVWRKDDGTEMEMSGEYREVTPPERIVNTERWGGDWPETVNMAIFTEDAGRTTVTVTIRYPSPQARDAALGTGMKDGAAQSFDRLASYLHTIA